MTDTTVRPFKIDISQSKIDRLNQKLALTDLPPEVEGSAPWARGVPLSETQRILSYWSSTYDWRKTEARLNDTLPQFTTDILLDNFGSLKVHFVHAVSSVTTAIPLLFMHGWPGNFTEIAKCLPLLISPQDASNPAFHVVAPSLIDFGFSSRSGKDGFNTTQHAHTYHKLMQRLGYEKYVIQGGDTGSFIARVMVQWYPEHIAGHLLNLAVPRKPTAERDPELYARIQTTALTDEEKEGLKRNPEFVKEGYGYNKLQSTKPLTIGYSITDSPVGLLTWIYEKMNDWSDSYPWTEEEVLQWVCIYYFSTPGPNASQQLYYDSTHTLDERRGQNYSRVPLGIARFPKELALAPKLWHETMGPLVYWRVHEQGGHFAAWEKPEELVGDLRCMFGRHGPLAGCCGRRRTGYIEGDVVSSRLRDGADVCRERSRL